MENRQQKSTFGRGTDGIRIINDDFNSHLNDNTTSISTSNDSQNYNIIIPQTSDITIIIKKTLISNSVFFILSIFIHYPADNSRVFPFKHDRGQP